MAEIKLSDLSRPVQFVLAFVGLCILFLLFRSPEVVVVSQPASSAQPAQEAVKRTGNISPIVREVTQQDEATKESLKLQSGDLEIGRLQIYLDPETRCQYVRPVYREGLTPRLRKDGHPWCE